MKQLFILLLAVVGLSAAAQTSYDKCEFTSQNGETLLYRAISPSEFKDGEKYPLVVFLHGAGERGNDNELQLKHGSGIFLNPQNRDNYPAFVVFPQCPEDKYWAFDERPSTFDPKEMDTMDEPSSQIVLIRELIEKYLENPQVDPTRVYIMGLSMGAMATFDMTTRYPELFAAAVPICGTSKAKQMKAASDISFWIFHGDADNVVPVEGSREAYRVLKAAGADLRYTEFAGCGHDSWNMTFNTTGLFEWLFSKRK